MRTTLVAGLKALLSTIILLGCYYFLAFLFTYDDRDLVVLSSALITFFLFFLHYSRRANGK
jgi:hypothetical protein